MRQSIPRPQTLEPKIWGQIGLRQGLYIGLGVFAGIFLLIALGPFGLGPRIAAALLAVAAGAAVGFMRVKGLSPERYIFHRLRFAIRRKGLGVWQEPNIPRRPIEVDLAPQKQRESSQKRLPSTAPAQPSRASRARVAPTVRPSECMAQASPFGLGFYVAALGTMGIALAYGVGFPLP